MLELTDRVLIVYEREMLELTDRVLIVYVVLCVPLVFAHEKFPSNRFHRFPGLRRTVRYLVSPFSWCLISSRSPGEVSRNLETPRARISDPPPLRETHQIP